MGKSGKTPAKGHLIRPLVLGTICNLDAHETGRCSTVAGSSMHQQEYIVQCNVIYKTEMIHQGLAIGMVHWEGCVDAPGDSWGKGA